MGRVLTDSDRYDMTTTGIYSFGDIATNKKRTQSEQNESTVWENISMPSSVLTVDSQPSAFK